MTLPTLTRRQVRELDRRAIEEFAVLGIVLMENAGRGVAEIVAGSLREPSTVVICCGKGNNAGDGFVIARHLDNRGIDVEILLWADPTDLAGDAATNFEIVRRCGLTIQIFGAEFDEQAVAARFSAAACIVDALLGTGAQGAPRPPLDRVIKLMNRSGRPIVAVDVPSGLDCDTGDAAGAVVRATQTCTFVAAKPGLLADHARPLVGQLHIVDIGAPRKLVEEMASQ